MPIFEATLSDGRIVTVESDREPTGSEILSAIGETPQGEAPSEPTAVPEQPWYRTPGPTRPGFTIGGAAQIPGASFTDLAKSGILTKPGLDLPRLDTGAVQAALAALGQPEATTPGAGQLAAAYNVAKTVPEFASSPVGATAALASAAVPPLAPFIGLGFGVDMARQVPEAARQAGAASVAGTPQEKAEAYLGLGANIALPGVLGAGGVRPVARILPRAFREAMKGDPNARQNAQDATLHGNVPTPPGEGPGQVPVQGGGPGVQPQAPQVAQAPQVPLTGQARQPRIYRLDPTKKMAPEEVAQTGLTPEDHAYLADERAAIDRPVDVVTGPLPEGDPFAGQIATADRAGQRILINSQVFGQWLRGVPEAQRPQAVRSLLSEERIHLAVDDAAAQNYWTGLTGIEKAIETRRYTGKWRGVSSVDPLMLGHEAIRFRMQQLARMTPREIAEAAGAAKWGMRGLTAVEDTVRTVRETLGTKASQEQLAILDRIGANLNTAKAAVSLGASPEAAADPVQAGNATIMGPGPFAIYKAYHGTPAEKAFDRFSLEYIGTGQGAQCYGYGLYFAQVPRVGQGYKTPHGFSDRVFEVDGERIAGKDLDPGSARAMALVLRREADHETAYKSAYEQYELAPTGEKQAYLDIVNEVEKLKNKKVKELDTGHFYQVDLDLDDGAILNWDEPLKSHLDLVQKLVDRGIAERRDDFVSVVRFQEWLADENQWEEFDLELRGDVPVSELHQALLGRFGSAKAVSESLADMGYQGIRYLDQFSREAPPRYYATDFGSPGKWYVKEHAWLTDHPSGPDQVMKHFATQAEAEAWAKAESDKLKTYNYVVFDDKRIKITARDGQPVSLEQARQTQPGAFAKRPRAEREAKERLLVQLDGHLRDLKAAMSATPSAYREEIAGYEESIANVQRQIDEVTESFGPAGPEQVFPAAMFKGERPERPQDIAQAIGGIKFDHEWDPKLKGIAPVWQFTLTTPGRQTSFIVPRGASFEEVRRKAGIKELQYERHIGEYAEAERQWDAQQAAQPTPGAHFKGGREPEKHPELFLPPVEQNVPQSPARGKAELPLPGVYGEATPERGGFPKADPAKVADLTDAFLKEAEAAGGLTARDIFTRYQQRLQRDFGAGVPSGEQQNAFSAGLAKMLVQAPGKRLRELVDELRLAKDVAEAVKPSEREPGLGAIPDALGLEQREFIELGSDMPASKKLGKYLHRYDLGPAQQRRLAAIGAILDKLSGRAKKTKAWSTAKVGPEDIAQVYRVREPAQPIPGQEGEWTGAEVDTKPAFYTLTREQRADPVAVGDLATSGAAIEATGKGAPPRTVSRNVVALKSPIGEIVLVNSWRDPRTGPRITNPAGAGDSLPIDADLLKRWEPFAVMKLAEPRQFYRDTFPSQAAFDRYFGDVAIEGTRGMKPTTLYRPEAGVLKRGLEPPAPEAFNPLLDPGFKLARPSTGLEPNPVEVTMPGPRRPIPTGRPLYRMPRAEPPAGSIPPERAAELGAGAAGQTPMFEVPKPAPGEVLPGVARPTGRLAEVGKPAEMGPGWPLRAGIEGGVTGRRTPAAFAKNVADEARAIGDTFRGAVLNLASADLIKRSFDDAANLPHNIAREIETGIRIQSVEKPGTLAGRAFKPWQQGNKQVLAAANAVVQAGGVRANGSIDNLAIHNLAAFQQAVAQGKAQAQALQRTGRWRDRRIGQVWERAADQLKEELDYAQAHWQDPDLQATASRMKLSLDAIWTELRRNGIDVAKEPNYLPGRYDMSSWDGRQTFFRMPRIWGTKWRQPKVFPDYYTAISQGPYIAATRDGASLVSHAVRKGLEMISHQQWENSLLAINGPDGRPIAIPVIRRPTGTHVSPDPTYKPTNIGGRFLAVQEDFAPLIRRLTGPSVIEDWAPSRALLHFEQLLKHNLLIGDFFHLGRMGYYALSIMGAKRAGWRGGWTALEVSPRDIGEAVRRGVITQEAADWAAEPVQFGNQTITRRDLLRRAQQGAIGLNIGKIQDALYKDLFTQLSPVAGPVKRGIARATDPTTGRYNRFLFDKLTRGFMAEAFVHEFERQSAKLPNADPVALMRDIARDTNNYFGSIGRQGWIDSKTIQDLTRLFFLAPQWVEGLIKKEAIGYSRLSGLSKLTGARQGLSALGTTGRGIGRGLLFMFGLTQAVNLIFRQQFTFQNQEKGHKFDAWIPPWGGRKEGFWFSPAAIFNEITHDIYRLVESKPKWTDALDQIASNKESPVTRAVLIGLGAQTPTGQFPTTSAGHIKAVGKALIPVPITFGRYGQLAAHAIAPNLVAQVPPQAIQRQVFGTFGVKVEPQIGPVGEVEEMARSFMAREGLQRTTGWKLVQTDEPGFSKLRAALRAEDEESAAKIFRKLVEQGRQPRDLLRSMNSWARRPFTGSRHAEALFKSSLSDAELERYSEAQADRMEQLMRFQEFYLSQQLGE